MNSTIKKVIHNSAKLINNIKVTNYQLYNIERISPAYFIMQDYYNLNNEDWKKYVNYYNLNSQGYHKYILKPYKYNDIIVNCNIITWSPGAKTDIHGHGEYSCMMMPIVGSLSVKTYNNSMLHNLLLPDAKYFSKKDIITEGDTIYIDDEIGFHKVSNNTDDFTISIHLYETSKYNIVNDSE